jgi:hypothetical protein
VFFYALFRAKGAAVQAYKFYPIFFSFDDGSKTVDKYAPLDYNVLVQISTLLKWEVARGNHHKQQYKQANL